MGRVKRVGRTKTFGISVDAEVEKFLREQAERRFGGNVSQLVTALAREEQSRQAAAWLLSRSKTYRRMTDEEAQAFIAGITRPKKSKRKTAA
jgi:hypothetical protein